MPTVIVRYRVKPQQADENIAHINAVFEALGAASPAGLRYASLVADDGISFTHIASIETTDGSNPLTELAEFKAFTAEIADRCDEPPAPAAQTVIGSYRIFE